MKIARAALLGLAVIAPAMVAITPVAGCRPSVTVSYYMAGTDGLVVTANARERVATFRGPGEWEAVVVASVALEAADEPAEVRRTYRPAPNVGGTGAAEGFVEVLLDHLVPSGSPSPDGEYTVSFYLKGLRSSQVLPGCSVVLDTTPPRIARLRGPGPDGVEVKEPLADGAEVIAQEALLRVSVDDRSASKLLAGGADVAPGPDGAFPLELPPPSNPHLDLEAVDAAGNRAVWRLRVLQDREPPRIAWPAGLDAAASSPELPLELRVEDDVALEGVSLQLNGKDHALEALEGGRFRARLGLEPGRNRIAVEARDKAGRRTAEERCVERFERFAWSVAGSGGAVHTSDPGIAPASFEGPEGREVAVAASFVPAAGGPAREVERRYRIARGKLEVPLKDFFPAEGPADGRWSLAFSVPGARLREEPPRSEVVLDRAPPSLQVEGAGEPGAAEVLVAAAVATLRVADASPVEVRAASSRLEASAGGAFTVQVPAEGVEVTAVDAAGNRAALRLRPAEEPAPAAAPAAVLPVEPEPAAAPQGAPEGAPPPGAAKPDRLEAAVIEDGGRRILEVKDARGRVTRLELPAAVERIERVPGDPPRFLVSTARDPEVLMAFVPGGAFPFGGEGFPTVEVGPFLMDCHEVTVDRYSRKADSAPAWLGVLAPEFRAPRQPAVALSWEDAAAFAAWAGKDLPEAREWELAAAWDGERRRAYPWGDGFAEGGIGGRWLAAPPRITDLEGDVSPWGVAGLGGGVREWVLDDLPSRPEHRRIRGGSSVHPRGGRDPGPLKAERFLATREEAALKMSKMNDVGFRCVIRLAPPAPRAAAAAGEGSR
ncbi:MAG: SUMF1/EgtB/PvdO family nonheme iron enzyme [Planctomycetes bacterium]|nr:SUMF1/EgtB/PvdO family nonheme iron enzyme [Planctomycetota bacterium]